MKNLKTTEQKNAEVLVEVIVDPDTPDHIQIQALNKLLSSKKQDNFFVTMMEERLSQAECPNCKHLNHWLIPEDELNKMGYVTAEHDDKVKINTTHKDCKRYQQACAKKKVNI